MKISLRLGSALLLCALSLSAGVITVTYGDVDGFGIGATTFKDPTVDNDSIGEAPFTDVRLIGSGFLGHGSFSPTATLLFAVPAGTITSVVVSMRLDAFGGNTSPVDGPNSVVVDANTISSAFLNSFSNFPDSQNPNIETQSFSLPASFFPLFADGSVNLTGTRISETSGSGSFQVDYLSFTVTTDAVPEPSTLGLLGLGLSGLGLIARRRR